MSESAKNPSMGVVLQMVSQNHDQAEQGHKRLRESVRDLEAQVSALETTTAHLEKRLEKAEKPIDPEKMSFTMRQTIAIVGSIAGTCLIMAGGMWQVQSRVSDVQTAIINITKLQDERNATQKESMDQLRAALEMRRVEIQNLSNFVQQQLGVKR